MAQLPLAIADIHLGVLVLLGMGVLGGALGAWFFQKIRIPQVVGYIAFGLLIGKSNWIPSNSMVNSSSRPLSGKDWLRLSSCPWQHLVWYIG
ncbi:MAG: hypothetical protein ACYTET_02335 [Planctomycetota bacterium]|jgi:hypothetical protein